MSYTPQYTNLVKLLQHCVQTYGDRPLFGTRGQHDWEWINYSDFGAMVDRLRAGLAGLGVGEGDRVAVISNNRVEWAACAYATYSVGAIYVPMYEAQLDKEYQYILNDAAAKVCLTANSIIEERVASLKPDLPELQHIVCFGTEQYASLANSEAATSAPMTPGDQDVATFIYTSGTTGNPKGVKLTHHNLAANVSAMLEVAPLGDSERSLAFLPWAHVFGGCVEMNSVMAKGGSLAICDNTDRLLSYLPEVQPTMLFAVPRIWNRIYDAVQKQLQEKPGIVRSIVDTGLAAKSKLRKGQSLGLFEKILLGLAEKLVFSKVVARFGGRLRFAFSGAAALSPEVAEFIDNLGIQVYEGYGMTESSGCTTANGPNGHRLGSVGKPVPGVDVKLDTNAQGSREGEGEIIIYGTGVMAGYHNMEQATSEAMTEDGGLRSGDLGRIDSDGFVYITGRVKELFKLANGKYVAPAPLEEKLQLSQYIGQCVIYGSDQTYNVALIVPDMGTLRSWAQAQGIAGESQQILNDPQTHALFRAEIDKHSKGFKGFESVRGFLLDEEEMSTANGMLTPTMKLKRRQIMAKYEDRLKALYK